MKALSNATNSKCLKSLLVLALLSSGLSFPTHAQAQGQISTASGGGSTGGGSTIDARMVEDYRIKDVTKDKRFESILAFLKSLEERAPALAKAMRENLNGLVWYVVPAELNRLPQYKTGLSFNTDQTAFQAYGEVFISEKSLDEMTKIHSEASLFIHEILMAEALKQVSSADAATHARVRKTTDALLDGTSGNAFNEMLLSNGFQQMASNDVYSYNVIMQDTRESQQFGKAVIIARKGVRMTIYTCNDSVFESLKQKQIDENAVEPAGFSYIAAAAVHSKDCQISRPFMYVVTKNFKKLAKIALVGEEDKTEMKGSFIGGAVGTAIVAVIAKKEFAPLALWRALLGGAMLGGALGAEAGHAGGAVVAISKQSDMHFALSKADTPTQVTLISGNPDAYADQIFKGLDELVSRQLITRTSFKPLK